MIEPKLGAPPTKIGLVNRLENSYLGGCGPCLYNFSTKIARKRSKIGQKMAFVPNRCKLLKMARNGYPAFSLGFRPGITNYN